MVENTVTKICKNALSALTIGPIFYKFYIIFADNFNQLIQRACYKRH